jgi:hypothetical protein
MLGVPSHLINIILPILTEGKPEIFSTSRCCCRRDNREMTYRLQQRKAAQLAGIPYAGGIYKAGKGKIFHRHACGGRIN